MAEDDLADGWFPESVAADYDAPGGANAPEVAVPMVVTIGDITTTRVAGQFSLAYLVFNTIGNVTTQDGQVDVFCNAAAHLRRGGLFLIEVGVPDLRRLPPGQDTVPFTVAPGRIPFRYAWPTEMDLMARIAGLSLKYRWAGWDRSAFTAESTTHVSVWQKR